LIMNKKLISPFYIFSLLLVAVMFFYTPTTLKAQWCGTPATAVTITPTGTFQNVTAGAGARRQFRFAATAGCTYDFSTCTSTGGNDTYLRIYSGTLSPTTGVLVTANDDSGPFCVGNYASLSWVATATGTFTLFLTDWASATSTCAALTQSTTLSYRVTCAAYDPCTTIPTITCGTPVSVTVPAGSGAYDPVVASCGFTTPGAEKIYSFTPATTGTYTISQPTSFGFNDFFYKPASGGCNNSGWTCIDNIGNADAGNAIVGISLTAGTAYYFMLDPETTTGGSVSFTINCSSYNPCSSIAAITCGVAVNATFPSGGGAYNPPSTTCSFATPGAELIYSYTPTVTGNYLISQPTSFNYIDYFYKTVAGGCNGAGWTCIDNITNGNVGNASVLIPLTAGTAYYFLLDAEATTGGTVSFTLNCPSSSIVNDACASATLISVPYNSGIANNTGATDDAPFSATCGFLGSNVWYKLIGTGNTITATTCDNNTAMDTEVRIFSGACGSLTEVTCNDDDGSCSIGFQSTVSFCSASGVEYYVGVGYWDVGPGFDNYVIKVTDGPVCITPLPIDLLSFTAKYELGAVKLNWSTASETNNDFFTVERSVDGAHFNTLTTMDAAGTSSSVLHYTCIDANPPTATVYYRLKQRDFDGAERIFPIISVATSQKEEVLRVFPNPSNGFFTVSGTVAGSDLRVTDLAGKTLFQKAADDGKTDIDIAHLKEGIYLLKLTTNGRMQTKKIIKN
jgi:hypothetical protein